MKRTAVISRDGTYRYALGRMWDIQRPVVLFVGLNPSTADHRVDDPTIRRCIQFASDWGFGGLAMANLFAFRTPSPRVLRRAANPVGPRNDAWLRRLVDEAELTVAAWGNHGDHMDRDRQVVKMLRKPKCLAITKRGRPKHPLYLPKSAELRDFHSSNLP